MKLSKTVLLLALFAVPGGSQEASDTPTETGSPVQRCLERSHHRSGEPVLGLRGK